MTLSVALFSAIYSALSSDAALTAALGGAGRIYDTPPEAAAVPYVVIGEETATDYSSSLTDAEEHTVTIHVWTEARSSLPNKTIQGLVRGALHEQGLALSAGTLCNLRCEFRETLRDPDGLSWHGVLRFRAVTARDTA